MPCRSLQRRGIRGFLQGESRPYDLLARTRRQVEAVGHVAASSHSHPFDTPLRAYSGQARDLREAMREPGIRVAEYCLVVNQWRLFLSAFAEDQGRKAVDEWDRRTLRSSKSEGGCFGGFRRINEGHHGRMSVDASWPRGDRQRSEVMSWVT